jgi:hypothetical protein
VGLALLDNDRQPQFANRAKATALNGRARLNIKAMSGRLIAATKDDAAN